ncbi:hypothetical protein M8J77_020305 [Diaphorina citri]|nr:hypothetical protein M8J77_020305 [Diaphorina citri]
MYRCDFDPDCSDGSDEAECHTQTMDCKEDEFQCIYPKCVRLEFRCDGDDDCGDNSDEMYCETGPCEPDEFRCNRTGACIPAQWQCDNEFDCEMGEDEMKCPQASPPKKCSPDEHRCTTGHCILKTWLCDGIPDCSLGEDERNCNKTCDAQKEFSCMKLAEPRPTEVGSNIKYFPLHTVRAPRKDCFSKKYLCDGKKHCPRGEDERHCPKRVSCSQNSPCHTWCAVDPITNEETCGCNPGYILSSDNITCVDIDECALENDPPCSQNCDNTIGSFKCSCSKGFILRPDERTCKPVGVQPTLLFANRIDIRQVSLSNKKYTAIIRNLHNVLAVDYHYKKNLLVWSDIAMDVIRISFINGSKPRDIVHTGMQSVGSLSVDWVHDFVFWTDTAARRVEFCDLDGKNRKILIANNIDKPRAVIVHPRDAFVFWTDWGKTPKIERVEMDGSNRKVILTENIFWPNGLTIDFEEDRLYWTEAKHHFIESSDLDGSRRQQVITKGLPHPFGITLYEDFVFWTDWHTKSISSANKYTGRNIKTVHSGLHFPMNIRSYHPHRQPNYQSHCAPKVCSHICLPNKHRFTCQCPLGLTLSPDNKSCSESPEELLIYARQKDLRISQLTEPSPTFETVLPVMNVKSVVAIAWESANDSLYWADVENGEINRAHINGTFQYNVIRHNTKKPAGVAIDWRTNKLYWTESEYNWIEVSNLDGTYPTLLFWQNLSEPRDIAVNPIGGIMYWCSWGDLHKIEMAGMDGSHRHILASDSLKNPTGLAIDLENSRLYWANVGLKTIEFTNLDGTRKQTLIAKGMESPAGITIYKHWLYISDTSKGTITAFNVRNDKASNATVLRTKVVGLTDIDIFHRRRSKKTHPCNENNGGCSHLCLIAPKDGIRCVCPAGNLLREDRRTCSENPSKFLLVSQTDKIRQISLDVEYRYPIVLPLRQLKMVASVDVDTKNEYIYWSDISEKTIERVRFDMTGRERLVVNDLNRTESIAVDAIGRKIYWTDMNAQTIMVSDIDGKNAKVLFWLNLYRPRSIVVHYGLGLMVWADWSRTRLTNNRIEMAHMDGTNRAVFETEVIWPSCLAIDYSDNPKLYWVDTSKHTIEYKTLATGRAKRAYAVQSHPYTLTVLDYYVYWTDVQHSKIYRANKYDVKDIVEFAQVDRPWLVRAAQNISFPNACGSNNGGCSHLCLRNPTNFTCACPTGILLSADRRSCFSRTREFLLYTSRFGVIRRISLDTADLLPVTLPFPEYMSSIFFDYHYSKNLIYFADMRSGNLRTFDMSDSTRIKPIPLMNDTIRDNFVIDWVANNIYYIDSQMHTINVARSDGQHKKILVNDLMEPLAIAVYPRRGLLFYSHWGLYDNSPTTKIEKVYLDGSYRTVLVEEDLAFPNELAIDFKQRRLFWADSTNKRIEYCDFFGRSRKIVISKVAPYGLSVRQSPGKAFIVELYWTDWEAMSVVIAREKSDTGQWDVHLIRSNQEDFLNIKAISASKQLTWNPCAQDNGGCSHLCFYKGRTKGYVCGCPDDLEPNEECFEVPRKEVDDIDEEDDLYEYEEYEDLPLSYSMVAVGATIGFILGAGLIALSITVCVKYKDPIRERLLATYRRHSSNNSSTNGSGPSMNISNNAPEILPAVHHGVSLPAYSDATSSMLGIGPLASGNNTLNRGHTSVRYIPSEDELLYEIPHEQFSHESLMTLSSSASLQRNNTEDLVSCDVLPPVTFSNSSVTLDDATNKPRRTHNPRIKPQSRIEQQQALTGGRLAGYDRARMFPRQV